MMAREDANMSLERHKEWERRRELRGIALRKVCGIAHETHRESEVYVGVGEIQAMVVTEGGKCMVEKLGCDAESQVKACPASLNTSPPTPTSCASLGSCPTSSEATSSRGERRRGEGQSDA